MNLLCSFTALLLHIRLRNGQTFGTNHSAQLQLKIWLLHVLLNTIIIITKSIHIVLNKYLQIEYHHLYCWTKISQNHKLD